MLDGECIGRDIRCHQEQSCARHHIEIELLNIVDGPEVVRSNVISRLGTSSGNHRVARGSWLIMDNAGRDPHGSQWSGAIL